jgi:hypothetical protein
MGTESRHAQGLRPTLRQGMILILWFAVLFAVLAEHFKSVCMIRRHHIMLRPGQFPEDENLILMFLLGLSPLLLGQLVVWLDRPGPARAWLAMVCRSLCYLLFGGSLIWQALNGWLNDEPGGSRVIYLISGVLFVGLFVHSLVHLCPTRCPRCARRAVVPLVRLFALEEPHTTPAALCVACGQHCTRKPGEPWSARPEPAMPPWQEPG